MSIVRFLPLLMLAVPVALAAQSMPVSTFLAKADALQKKGPMALFSGDMKLLQAQLKNSGKALRAEQNADAKAGRKASLCMPPKASVNSTALLTYLKTVPVAQRSMPFGQAFRGFIQRKYPCPA